MPSAIRIATLTIAAMFVESVAFCADEPTSVLLDMRTKAKADGTVHYVVFCAKTHNLWKGQKSVGHAWVMWAVDDAKQQACRLDKAFGFWPDEGKGKFSLLTVPGEVVNELVDPKKRDEHFGLSHRLILRVDENVYFDSQRQIDKWKSDEEAYSILFNSCKNFVSAVARECGILTDRADVNETDWPETYLQKLIARAILTHADRKK